MPAKNSAPTDSPVIELKITIRMLGGMIGPKIAELATMAAPTFAQADYNDANALLGVGQQMKLKLIRGLPRRRGCNQPCADPLHQCPPVGVTREPAAFPDHLRRGLQPQGDLFLRRGHREFLLPSCELVLIGGGGDPVVKQ